MPEEINRFVTDSLSDFLFVTDWIAAANLRREGVDPTRIFLVGNVMIDSLLKHLSKARHLGMAGRFGVAPRGYATLTLHRAANVDNRDRLVAILDAIAEGSAGLPVIFPCHPRTRGRIEAFGLASRFAEQPGAPGIWLTQPMGYLEFLGLNDSARLIMTDSGGLQEEATVLGIPCVTLRDGTERPITVIEGTSIIAGTEKEGMALAIEEARRGSRQRSGPPEKWDGCSAPRIISILLGEDWECFGIDAVSSESVHWT